MFHKVTGRGLTFHLLMVFFLLATAQISCAVSKVRMLEEKKYINGPPPTAHDETDGDIYPFDVDWVASKIKAKVPDIISKIYNPESNQYEWFIHFDEKVFFNDLFFLLRELYPDNIACDTATILYGYRMYDNPLSLNELHEFLKARALMPASGYAYDSHPYFQLKKKLMKSFGETIENTNHLSLNEILDDIEEQAIIHVHGHIGIIKRVGATDYTVSGWDPWRGMSTRNIHYYDKNTSFDSSWEEWGVMKIEDYIPLTNPIYPNMEATAFNPLTLQPMQEHMIKPPTDSQLTRENNSPDSQNMEFVARNNDTETETGNRQSSIPVKTQSKSHAFMNTSFQFSSTLLLGYFCIKWVVPKFIQFAKKITAIQKPLPRTVNEKESTTLRQQIDEQLRALNTSIAFMKWKSVAQRRNAINISVDVEDKLDKLTKPTNKKHYILITHELNQIKEMLTMKENHASYSSLREGY